MMHMGDDAHPPCDDGSPFFVTRLLRGGTNCLDTVYQLGVCTIVMGKITIEQDPTLN
jgi:hypothetical protein